MVAAAGCILYAAEMARAADFAVYNHFQLRNAILAAGNGDTITFGSDIPLDAFYGQLPNISSNVSIIGNGFALNGGNTLKGFTITGGTVSITDLTIINTRAQGATGEGGSPIGPATISTGGGGGGAGLGGAIFVGTGANVTVTNVNFTSNSARGGNGGTAGGGSTTPGNGGAGSSNSGAVGTGGTVVGGAGTAGGFAAGGGGGADGDPGDPDALPTPIAITPGGNGGAGGYGAGGGGGGSGGGSSPGPTIVPGVPGLGAAGGGWAGPVNVIFGGGAGSDGTVNTAGQGGGGAGMGGAVFVQAGGTINFGGTSSVSGNTVAGGTGANSGGAFGSGMFLQNGTTATFSPTLGNTITFSNVITDEFGSTGYGGSGSIIKTEAGTLILLGNNTYSGGTTVSAGVLQGNTNSLQGGIFDDTNGTVTFDQGFNGTFIGTITGNGKVIKTNTGILTYNTTQDNRGGTYINAGTLNATDVNVLPGGQDIFINNAGSSVVLNGFNQSIGGLFGDIGTTINLGSALLTIDPTSTITNPTETGIYSGDIIGVGGSILKNGPGTQILLGTNTYSGGTTISGGILQGTTNSLQGNILFTGNASLIFDQAINGTFNGSITSTNPNEGLVIKNGTGAVTYGAAQANTGGTTVNAGSLIMGGINYLPVGGDVTVNGGTLNLNNFNQSIGGLNGTGGFVNLGTAALTVNPATTATYAGTIFGPGSFIKNGTGTQILTGTNTYSGGTTVNAGILQGNSNSLQGDILNNASVIFDQAINGTYAGVMSGTGSLTKENTGTLILTGANTYGGGTIINGGILQGNTTSLQGNILNNTTLIFDQAINGTFSGNITGPGLVIKQNVGTLVYGAAQNNTGGTTINGGILQMGGTNYLPGTGDVTVNSGSLDLNNFDQSIAGLNGTGGTVQLTSAILTVNPATTATYAGSIQGPGIFMKNGSGTQILTGVNTYSGGTIVNGGILQGNTDSLQGTILNDATVVFDQALNGTYAGIMGGIGSLVKQNVGTLILTGANNYSGGTFVNGGILQGDTTSLQGNIFNNAAVVFDQAITGTFGGTISGAGTVTKQNVGELIINSPQTYTGQTIVNQGLLTVNSSIAGPVLVNPAGTLGGTGAVGSTTVNGTIAPGASGGGIGALTVNGSYTQNAGSTYQLQINEAGQSDRIDVNGAARINGGNVQIVGTLRRGLSYTILTATGGETGQFSSVTGGQQGYITANLIYNPTNIQLLLESNFEGGLGGTDNQISIEQYFDGLLPTAGSDLDNIFAILDTLTPDQARAAFDQIAGAQNASLITLDRMKNLYLIQQIADQVRSSLYEEALGGTVVRGQSPEEGASAPVYAGGSSPAWFKAYGVSGGLSGDGNAPGIDYTFSGAIAGIESRPDRRTRTGLIAGYTNNIGNYTGTTGDAKGDGAILGLYAAQTYGSLYWLGAANYGYTQYDTRRQIAFPGVNRVATATTDTHDGNAYIETGYLASLLGMTIQPIGGLQYMWMNQGGFSETGAGALNLTENGQTAESLWVMAGGRLTMMPIQSGMTVIKPYIHGKWVHDCLSEDRLITGALTGAGGSFIVRGATAGRDFIVGGAGIGIERGNVSLGADYTALTNDQQTSHTGAASIQVRW